MSNFFSYIIIEGSLALEANSFYIFMTLTTEQKSTGLSIINYFIKYFYRKGCALIMRVYYTFV